MMLSFLPLGLVNSILSQEKTSTVAKKQIEEIVSSRVSEARSRRVSYDIVVNVIMKPPKIGQYYEELLSGYICFSGG